MADDASESRWWDEPVSSRRSLVSILRIVIFLVIAFFMFSNFTDGFFSFGP